ncbi:hypothetical protein VPH35_119329 [Triticum aestivum]|uniref:uncharacterized protein isoform X1 n=1 Tax=Triticum aestivum TaxID=4565 RepID=UPI000845092C|nr:uncharacterized protein LOC123142177 isoform X1 [Triticum aestivum]
MKLNRVRRRRRDLLKVDRLIKLPDDVLLNILERLGTLDAVRTCVVSKQTLNLPSLLSQIVIDLSDRDLHRKNRGVADMTDKILSTRSPQVPIRNLKLRFIMRGDDHIKIGRAVALAMATQKIDAAEFEILTKDIYYRRTDADLLDSAKLFNNFIVECADAFAGLTRLHLQNLRLRQWDITNILTTCKRLESLRLLQCDARKLPVLHVEHARLVELTFAYAKFSTVELGCLPKLRRMTLHRWIFDNLDNPLILGYVPQLSKLTLAHAFIINRTLKLSQLLVNVPSISDLHLDFQSEKVWVLPECPKVLAPVLGKLRRMNLNNLPEECDISWTMFLLEAAPSLEELCITVWDHKCQLESQKSYYQKTDVKWEPSTPDFKHNNLSRLTIYGFQPNDNFMGYVRRVIEAVENIKEVSLHDRKVCEHCVVKFPHLGVRPWSCPRTSEEVDSFRLEIAEVIKGRAMAVASTHKIRHDLTKASDNDHILLSKLPNDDIAERVGTVDLVRTCILSRQMHKLPRLADSPRYYSPLFRSNQLHRGRCDRQSLEHVVSADYRSQAEAQVFLSPSRCHSIGKSAGLAMVTQKLDATEFEILTPRDTYYCTEAYPLLFVRKFSNFVRHCANAFAGLTRPQLHNMRFSELDIQNILSTCKRLKSLCFFECDAGIRSTLHVKHTRVLELVISYGEFKTKELDRLPKLQQTTYNVPSVSDLYQEYWSEKIWVQRECPKLLTRVVLLAKLRFVNLDNLPEECDIAWTMFLLDVAPSLEALRITSAKGSRITVCEEVDSLRKKIIEAKEKVDSLRKNVIQVINSR